MRISFRGDEHDCLVVDVLGHVALIGEIGDPPGIGNRLQFHFLIDQTALNASILELRGVMEAFPVR